MLGQPGWPNRTNQVVWARPAGLSGRGLARLAWLTLLSLTYPSTTRFSILSLHTFHSSPFLIVALAELYYISSARRGTRGIRGVTRGGVGCH